MIKADALAALSKQAARRAAARDEQAAAMNEIRQIARTAHEAGVAKADIARAAKISRVTLDAILHAATP